MVRLGNHHFRNQRIWGICFSWILGLCIGFVYSLHISADSLSFFHLIPYNRASLMSLLLIIILPFVISAILIYYSKPFFLFFIVLFKAFCFSFCSCSIIITFGWAGWLIRWLLLFSDSCSVVLWLWFLFRYSVNTTSCISTDLFLCITASVSVGCFDSCILAPFSVLLLNY